MDYYQEEYYAPPPPNTSQDQSTLPPFPNDEYNGMPPPPESEYHDLPELIEACQRHGRQHGYACVTSSNNYKRGIAYVRCDRGGEYVNHWKLTDETRVRKNRTRRLVGCKWKARAKRNAAGLWVLTMMHDKHTGHGPSENATAHPSLRQLSTEAQEAAKQAFMEQRSPKQVLEMLQQTFNPAVTAQDVYNLKAKITRTESAKNTPAKITQRTEPDIPTDPALQMHDAGLAQPAVMPPPSFNGAVPDHKCQCKCCDH
ncbi:Transcription factor rbf1 (RPG-box-binding factor) (Repressor-activator protein 1) [Lecanora helva]